MANQMPPTEAKKQVQVVGKLTVKVGADPKKVATAEGGRLWLCDLFGRGVKLKQGIDKRTDNPWTAIEGKFEAYYPETETTYQSGKLFLPTGIQEVVETAIGQLPKDDAMASVDFAFRMFAVKASNPIGYSYEAQPLIDLNQNDGLGDMRQMIERRRSRELQQGINPATLVKSIPAAEQILDAAPAAPVIDVEPEPPVETEQRRPASNRKSK